VLILVFQNLGLQSEVVDGCEDDTITPTPTFTPPTLLDSLPVAPLLELSSIPIIDDATPTQSEDALEEQQLEPEAIPIPESPVITIPIAVEEIHESEPTSEMIPLPESPVIVHDPVPAQLEDFLKLEAEPQPTPESSAVAILAVLGIIPEDAPLPESEDAPHQEPKPVLEVVPTADEACSVDVLIKDVSKYEPDPDSLLIVTYSQLEDATEPEPSSMAVPVLVPEREPESDLSLVATLVEVTPVDDPTPSDPLPFAADPKPEGIPQSPPDLSPPTYCAECSTAGESPPEETKLPRIRRRIRRSIKRARKEADSSSTAIRQVITSTTPTRSQSSPQRVPQSPSNRSDPIRAQRDSDYRARARRTRQTPSESTPVASSSSRVRQNPEPRTRQYRPWQTRQSVASSSRVQQNPEPRARPRRSGQSHYESVPVASFSMMQQTPGRHPRRDHRVGRMPFSRQ
jgi:hypothetical protein